MKTVDQYGLEYGPNDSFYSKTRRMGWSQYGDSSVMTFDIIVKVPAEALCLIDIHNQSIAILINQIERMQKEIDELKK